MTFFPWILVFLFPWFSMTVGSLQELTFIRVDPSIQSHISFYSRPKSLAIWHVFPDITYTEYNNSNFLFYKVEILLGTSLPKVAHFVLL